MSITYSGVGAMSDQHNFSEELRECLDAAGYSDCGENDQWNYWYQRLHKAHDAAVDRVTETQRAENVKLRELCKAWREFAYEIFDECFGEPELNEDFMTLDDRMEALGIEVDA